MDYLSDEWIAAADTALKGAAATFGAIDLTIAQCVVDARCYVLSINCEAPTLTACTKAEIPANTLRFSQTWATACSVARAETDAHQAFLLGDISFSGNVEELVQNAAVLAHVATALAPVMNQTTFPEHYRP